MPPNPRDNTWVELWKNLGGLYRRNVDLTKETEECFEEIEKWERFTGSNHSGCFESIASGFFGESGEIVVVDVLGYDLPGRLGGAL